MKMKRLQNSAGSEILEALAEIHDALNSGSPVETKLAVSIMNETAVCEQQCTEDSDADAKKEQ